VNSKPGEELDRLVAERVLGLKVRRWPHFWSEEFIDENGKNWVARLRPYSTDIAAAWEVMDYVLEQDDQLLFLRFADAVRFAPEGDIVAPGYLAAHRICLAALRAVGVDVDNLTQAT
jgi:hypothetical protein